MARADGMNRAEREACWRERIAACASSGLPITRYCRAAGISVAGYHWWRRELKRRDSMSVLPALFAEVRPVAPDRAVFAPPIEISLPGERLVRVHAGFDGHTLAQVVLVLEGLGC